MGHMDRKSFLEVYEYDVESEFSVDNVPATWAGSSDSPAHRFWGAEDERIVLPVSTPAEVVSAISSDKVLLATAIGKDIHIYDVKSKKRLSTFRGPFPHTCQQLVFVPRHVSDELYQIVSVHEIDRSSGSQVSFWHVNREGARPDAERQDHIDISGLALQSLDAIKPVLKQLHDVDSSSTLLENVLQDYTSALDLLDSKVQARHLKSVGGILVSRNHQDGLFSPDRRLILLKSNNGTTQRGMRPREELPQIIVYDFQSHLQKQLLAGHDDVIVWAAFSPDGKTVASASWDQTFRLWDVETGGCTHVIGPTGSQNWSGAWSPDSEHLLLSGMETDADEGTRRFKPMVAIYSRSTGKEVARFEDEKSKDRTLQIAWCPTDNIIAISSKANIWIWLPFDDIVISRFELKFTDRLQRSFAAVTAMMWTTDGRKLIVKGGGSTIEVWDRIDNVKWRFQRPNGTPMAHGGNHIDVVEENVLESLDGDGVVRFWHL